jgi:hypothetical protein
MEELDRTELSRGRLDEREKLFGQLRHGHERLA